MRRASRLIPLLLCLASLLAARDFTALRPEGFVSDFARVVDRNTRAKLERYCALLQQKTGVELALVTLDTLEGEPIEDVANAIFRAWGIGKKGKDEGLLLLLAIRDRRHRLEVGYGLEGVLPDGYAGSLLREMRPALREGRYGDALLLAAHTIGARVAQAKGVDLEAGDLAPRRPAKRDGGAELPLPLLIGAGVLFLLLLLGGGGGILPWLFLGSMMRRGGGGFGSSGGGFGGYDSGGGFGGFGGGASGGGGASSSW